MNDDLTGMRRVRGWLELFLDEEHKRLLARIDEANESDIQALDRHIKERLALLGLALNAGDLAEEIARTYELLGDSGYEGESARDVMRGLV